MTTNTNKTKRVRTPEGVIDDKLREFRTSTASLKKLGHEIAMLIFDNCYQSDNCTRALKLAEAMPKSWKAQLESWFAAYTPIRVSATNGKVALHGRFKAERDKEAGKNVKATAETAPNTYAAWWKRDAAEATPFYDHEAERDSLPKVLDFAGLLAMVRRMAKTIDSRIEKGEVRPEDVPSAKALSVAVAAFDVKPVKVPKAANDKPKATRPAAKSKAPAAPALTSVAA